MTLKMKTVLPILLAFGIAIPFTEAFAAPLTAVQKKELSSIRSSLSRVGILVRLKKGAEAAELLEKTEQELNEFIKTAKPDPNDPNLSSLKKTLEFRRKSIKALGSQPAPQPNNTTKATPKAPTGHSFVKDVAPIFTRRCSGCHRNNRQAGLNLTTYTNMKKGGNSGEFISPGKANASTLIERITTQGPRRMPRNAASLTPAEIKLLTEWVNQGAKFDGNDPNLPLAQLKTSNPGTSSASGNMISSKVKVNLPTGTETVSFKADIAPFMVNICMRCHSGNKPRSDFSLETFEKLMIGGSSGRVVLPGDLDGSRLWDLVGKQKPFKMPQGNQVLITKTNWRNLRTWIEEGARYDGGDPTKSLRELVPTEEELLAQKLAKMTPQEFAQMRKTRSEELWKRVINREEPKSVESKEFFVFGNVSESRLQEVSNWAENHASELRKAFGENANRIWKGKLTIFLVKDRFGYEEFNFTLLRRQTPKEMNGHSVVTSTYEDAYIAMQDIGDAPSETSPGLKLSLAEQVTSAYFSRGDGNKLPAWVKSGTGLAFAATQDKKNPYLSDLDSQAKDLLQTVDAKKPEVIFSDKQFSPSGSRIVGYSLVNFLIKRGGTKSFGKFIQSLENGTSLSDAFSIDL